MCAVLHFDLSLARAAVLPVERRIQPDALAIVPEAVVDVPLEELLLPDDIVQEIQQLLGSEKLCFD